MSEWQIIAALLSVVLGLIGVLYHIHDRRLKGLETWREELTEELPKTREHYLREIALTYATKESFDRLEKLLAGNHTENSHRLERIDGSLGKLAEMGYIIKAVQTEVGDHQSGLRGQVHEQRRQLVLLAGKVPGGLEVFE